MNTSNQLYIKLSRAEADHRMGSIVKWASPPPETVFTRICEQTATLNTTNAQRDNALITPKHS